MKKRKIRCKTFNITLLNLIWDSFSSGKISKAVSLFQTHFIQNRALQNQIKASTVCMTIITKYEKMTIWLVEFLYTPCTPFSSDSFPDESFWLKKISTDYIWFI